MSIQLNYTTSGHRMNKEYKHFITNFAIRSNYRNNIRDHRLYPYLDCSLLGDSINLPSRKLQSGKIFLKLCLLIIRGNCLTPVISHSQLPAHILYIIYKGNELASMS